MARRGNNFLIDVLQGPWWLNAVLGVASFLISNHVKALKAGIFPIGLLLSPLLKILAAILVIGAIVSLLITIARSALGLGQRNRYAQSPKTAFEFLMVDILRAIFEAGQRKWAGSWAGAGQPHSGLESGLHAANATFPHCSGTATVLGESGAWIDIAQDLQRQGFNIRKIGDIEPLLRHLRETFQASVARFNAEVAKCVQFKDGQIAALWAERGFGTTFLNFFIIPWRKWEIFKLHREERRYSVRLSESIETLEAVLLSPELAGAKAELEVIEELRSLPGDFIVLNNVQLRATRSLYFNKAWLQSAQIDHLALSPAGVFVIETKRWSKQFAAAGQYHNPYDQVRRAGYLCYSLLKKYFVEIPVRSIILSAGSLPPAPENSFVKVLHLKELTGYLTWFNQRAIQQNRFRDIRQYLEQHMVHFKQVAAVPTNMGPEEALNSAFLKKIRLEAGLENLKSVSSSTTPRKSRAVLIPTEPPPLKPEENRRYMPPAMRKELEDKERKKMQELLSRNSAAPGAPETKEHAEPLPPNAPKDLKYMPPAMRAEFEEK